MFDPPSRAPIDFIGVIRRLCRDIAAGLDINDPAAIADFAQHAEADLAPRIIPDRRYSIAETLQFGFTKSAFYKSYAHVIRVDPHSSRSYVIGRDLLQLIESAPTLDAVRSEGAAPGVAPRRHPGARNGTVPTRLPDAGGRRRPSASVSVEKGDGAST